jgi:hypothetical protein
LIISPQTVDTGAAALLVTVGDSDSESDAGAGAACDTATENESNEQIKNEKRAIFRGRKTEETETNFDASRGKTRKEPQTPQLGKDRLFK